jgi:hypothetical protein
VPVARGQLNIRCSSEISGQIVEGQTPPHSYSVFRALIPQRAPISCGFHFKFCLFECYFLSLGFHQGQRNLQQIKNANVQWSPGNLPTQCLNNSKFKVNKFIQYTTKSTSNSEWSQVCQYIKLGTTPLTHGTWEDT